MMSTITMFDKILLELGWITLLLLQFILFVNDLIRSRAICGWILFYYMLVSCVILFLRVFEEYGKL